MVVTGLSAWISDTASIVTLFGAIRKFLMPINRRSNKKTANERLVELLVKCVNNAYKALCESSGWEYDVITDEFIWENWRKKNDIYSFLEVLSGSDETHIVDDQSVKSFMSELYAEICSQQPLYNRLNQIYLLEAERIVDPVSPDIKEVGIIEERSVVEETNKQLVDGQHSTKEERKKQRCRTSNRKRRTTEEIIISSEKKYLDKTVELAIGKEDMLDDVKKAVACCLKRKDKNGNLTPISFRSAISRITRAVDEKHRFVMAVEGLQGTGKSTFISLVYYDFLIKKEDNKVVPFIIDLHYWGKSGKNSEAIKSAVAKEIKTIKRVVSQHNYEKYIFLIDGLDDGVIGISNIIDDIQSFEDNKDCYFIFSISLVEKISEKLRQTSSWINSCIKKAVVPLEMHRLKKEQDDVIKKVVSLLSPVWGVSAGHTGSLTEAIVKTAVNKIDFRTIVHIVQVFKKIRGIDVTNISLGNIFYMYYDSLIKIKSKFLEVAKHAFYYEIEQDYSKSQEFEFSAILHQNSSTRDFFLAVFYINLFIRDDYCQDERESFFSKNLVFTAQVNRFIKELLDSVYAGQVALLIEKSANIYPSCSLLMKSQICYVMGRINGEKTNQECCELFLKTEFEQLKGELFEKSGSGSAIESNDLDSKLFLFRTISVSLIKFNSAKEEQKYFLSSLLSSERLSRINRGFHLAYYEDKSYINGTAPLFVDPLDSEIDKTMNHLLGNVSRSVDERSVRYKMLYLDIITLFSLYQYRITDSIIKEKYEKTLSSLVEKLLESGIIERNQIVKEYLITLRHYFENYADKTYASIISELYRVKSIKRTGWLNRGIINPESIADHMYSSYLLALFFLPEDINTCVDYQINDLENYKHYSKKDVLEMLLLHDLAETITGDIPSQDQTEDDQERERQAINIYAYLYSFPHLYGLGEKRKLWDEFDKRSSINAKLAKEIDKIDALVQAYLYERQDVNRGKTGILVWERDTTNKVKTSLGTEILKLIKYSFGWSSSEE